MRTGYVIAVLAGLCAPVMAEDLPPNQILYNTKEVSGIIVRCTKISAIQADCDFFQMAVRKHVTKEDLKKRFAQIDSFMKEPLKKQDCDLFGALAVSLRTGRAVGGAKQELLTQFLNDKDRAREMMKVLDPLVTFCRNPTLENARRVIEAEYDKDMRTCYVSVNPFRQSFTLNVSSGHWEHVSPPDGACGVVQLTYFEKAPDAAANLPFWRWVTSKKILNKEATDLFGKCSGLDEAEYVYDWHSTENLMHCDFIQFDVL